MYHVQLFTNPAFRGTFSLNNLSSYLKAIYFIYAKMAITNHGTDDNITNNPDRDCVVMSLRGALAVARRS